MCKKCVPTSTMIIPIFSETLNVFPLQIGSTHVFLPKNSKMTWKRVCVSIFGPEHIGKRGCVSIREAGHIWKRVCIKCVSLCFLYNCTYRHGPPLKAMRLCSYSMKTLHFAAKNARYSWAKQYIYIYQKNNQTKPLIRSYRSYNLSYKSCNIS